MLNKCTISYNIKKCTFSSSDFNYIIKLESARISSRTLAALILSSFYQNLNRKVFITHREIRPNLHTLRVWRPYKRQKYRTQTAVYYFK